MTGTARTYENRLKDALAAGQASIGGWMCTSSPAMAEAMATLGFDWLAVDLEHTATDIADCERIIVICERYGIAPLARLAEADPITARRLLDLGMHGFILPQSEDPEQIAEFAAHLYYPPAGKRGICLSRMNAWGDDFTDYLGSFRPVLVAQVESAAGIANVGGIAALEAIDALFIGPYDLSADLGCPGDFNAPSIADALYSFRAACRQAGKPMGIHQVDPDPDALRARLDEGYRFIAYGTDTIAARKALAGIAGIKRD